MFYFRQVGGPFAVSMTNMTVLNYQKGLNRCQNMLMRSERVQHQDLLKREKKKSAETGPFLMNPLELPKGFASHRVGILRQLRRISVTFL